MEEAKQLLEIFIRLEKEIHEYFLLEKIELHNQLVDEITKLSIEEMPVARKKSIPLTMIEQMVIDNTEIKVAKPRDLFKITEYENQQYGKLWACYVSVANPVTDEVKSIAFCFIVAKVDNELKLISQFFYDEMDDFQWKRGGGLPLNFYELGKVVAVERLLSPLVDEWSLEEYMLDR